MSFLKICALILTVFTTAQLLAAETQSTFKFGVVPQQAATQLLEKWGPLIKKMSLDCGCKIEFVSTPDIPQFESHVQSADYDLVYLNPMHFVQAIPVGYHALVKEQGRKLKGILVVEKNSPIKTLSDLKEKKVAFPGPTSFAATVLIQKMFEKEKVKIESVFVKSHDSVYLNIISGLFSAGGGVNRTFDSLTPEDRAKLKIIATTQEVTPHPIAIHDRVQSKFKNLFLKTLTNLNSTSEGQKILNDLELKSLVPALDSDWNDVKKMIEPDKK